MDKPGDMLTTPDTALKVESLRDTHKAVPKLLPLMLLYGFVSSAFLFGPLFFARCSEISTLPGVLKPLCTSNPTLGDLASAMQFGEYLWLAVVLFTAVVCFLLRYTMPWPKGRVFNAFAFYFVPCCVFAGMWGFVLLDGLYQA